MAVAFLQGELWGARRAAGCGCVHSAVPRPRCSSDKSRRFARARPVRPPVQAVPFAEQADFYYYYFLCKRASVSLLYACACWGPGRVSV